MQDPSLPETFSHSSPVYTVFTLLYVDKTWLQKKEFIYICDIYEVIGTYHKHFGQFD